MKYKVKNMSERTVKTYENELGQRIKFEPLEEKILSSYPQDYQNGGWKIEELEENSNKEEGDE